MAKKVQRDEGVNKTNPIFWRSHYLNGPSPYHIQLIYFQNRLQEKKFKQIGGANTSKVVNNIINAISTKELQKQFVWDSAADNSFQNLTNILACIYSVVCSEEITHHKVNNIIQNTLKNARSKS